MDNENNKPEPENNQNLNNEPSETVENNNVGIKIASSVFDIVEMFALCTVIILMVYTFFFRITVVDGQSMENTLYNNQYLITRSIGYTPKAGDIVVFHDLASYNHKDPLIKRVIATEGQEVDIDFETWTLKVDGKIVDEPYRTLKGAYTLKADYTFPVTVPEGCIFVLGDNRNNSSDSRRLDIGMVDVRCVVGKAVWRILPFNVFGSIYE